MTGGLTMRDVRGATLVGVATAGLLLAMASASSAQPRDRGYGPPRDYVVAESRWGKGTVSGPVRRSSTGWQVRLPRGTWIDCVRSCSETLRRQTVDFWESQGPHARDQGPGYFQWHFYPSR